MSDYDVIVVGLGAMGGAAAYHLARRGQRVLGLDAFPAGHTLGSSHGETRIIRMAYFEHPDYVPLLKRAYELWSELETEARMRLLHLTGGLFVGPVEGDLVSGSKRSAEVHGLPHELLDAAEIRRRFPAFAPREHEMGLFEPRAGVLLAEQCLEAHLSLAARHGAELHHAEPLTSWAVRANEAQVETPRGRYRAAKLVVTAGAWNGKLLHDVELQLVAERIPLFWFEPVRNSDQFELGRQPIWIWQQPEFGDFFGTPHVTWPGVKVGKHHSQQYVDPDAVDRQASAADEAPLRDFLERCMPDLAGPIADSRVCLYTNTPDLHFVVDRHARYPNVIYAGGFSGHGFKFATVIGEILADLTIDGRATPSADFLRAARLSDPKSGAGASR
jgi:sarcosine oxidase